MTKIFRRFQMGTGLALALLGIGLGGTLTPVPAIAEPASQWLLVESTGQIWRVKSGVTPVVLTPVVLTVGSVATAKPGSVAVAMALGPSEVAPGTAHGGDGA